MKVVRDLMMRRWVYSLEPWQELQRLTTPGREVEACALIPPV